MQIFIRLVGLPVAALSHHRQCANSHETTEFEAAGPGQAKLPGCASQPVPLIDGLAELCKNSRVDCSGTKHAAPKRPGDAGCQYILSGQE